MSEVSIHTDLICAVSEPIKRTISGRLEEAKNPVELPNVSIEQFKILVKWLYGGRIPFQHPPSFTADEFWALVFTMSRHLEVAALQLIAFDKFEECFSISDAPTLPGGKMRNPSPQLLRRFLKLNEPQNLILDWVMDHLYWANECMSSAFVEAAALFKSCPGLSERYCEKLVSGEPYV